MRAQRQPLARRGGPASQECEPHTLPTPAGVAHALGLPLLHANPSFTGSCWECPSLCW